MARVAGRVKAKRDKQSRRTIGKTAKIVVEVKRQGLLGRVGRGVELPHRDLVGQSGTTLWILYLLQGFREWLPGARHSALGGG
jgi:hypothetical protein